MVKKRVKKVTKSPSHKVTKSKIKRPKAKKVTRPKAKKAKSKAKKPQGLEATLEKIGVITHYFPHVNAAAVKLLKSGLKVGDSIYIKGHTTDFKELVQSIQLDHATIPEGKKGQEIGLLVKSRVRQGDKVYKI
jgi:translation elongation factor EF-1alpha